MTRKIGFWPVTASLILSLAIFGGCSHNTFVTPTSNVLTPIPTATATASMPSPTAIPLTPSPTATSTAITPNTATYTPPQADNILSCNLYNYYESQSGNVFFSPFSIITALAMAQEGAVGNTATQMQNVLNLNSNATIRQQGWQQLITALNTPGRGYTLNVADNLWLQQGFPFLTSYLNTVQTYYAAGVTNVDYINNPTAALQTINGAVSQETGGYIPSLLSPNNITPKTRLVLTDAIYFNGSWKYQFPVTATNQQPFTMANGNTESVSMMHVFCPGVIESYNGVASVLAIPYTNNGASMYIFLPPLGGMAALENDLTGADINAWMATNSAVMTGPGGSLNLSLPKFTFSDSYDLTSILSQMGMSLAFTPPRPGPGADFSGMDGTNNLYITDVVHQAYIDVSETGTTAAAATGVVMGCPYCMIATVTPSFTVNSPFVFMIVDNATNTVLFLGRVNSI
jgi:serpin B